MKSKPYATLQRISGQSTGMVLMSQLRPRNLPDLTPAEQMKKTEIFISDPQIPGGVFNDAKHVSAGNTADGNKPVILHIAEAARGSYPDSAAIILKKRSHSFIR